MAEPLTREEQKELYWRAKRLYLVLNCGSAYALGDYVIDFVSTWCAIYNNTDGCVYSGDASGSHHIDSAYKDHEWGHTRRVLSLMQQTLVLHDLADVSG